MRSQLPFHHHSTVVSSHSSPLPFLEPNIFFNLLLPYFILLPFMTLSSPHPSLPPFQHPSMATSACFFTSSTVSLRLSLTSCSRSLSSASRLAHLSSSSLRSTNSVALRNISSSPASFPPALVVASVVSVSFVLPRRSTVLPLSAGKGKHEPHYLPPRMVIKHMCDRQEGEGVCSHVSYKIFNFFSLCFLKEMWKLSKWDCLISL